MFIEMLFKMLLFKGGVLIYAEYCMLFELPYRPMWVLAVLSNRSCFEVITFYRARTCAKVRLFNQNSGRVNHT